ncbi:MAG TPA: signal peptidase I [Thermoanaerobaculia bacterium]|nr:signal peptidase I [Thermoanaerobaculia bacterium]
MSEARPQPVWREYLEALLVAGLFLGFTNTFVLKTFYIPSGSMEKTLLVGDHLIVNRYVFGGRDGGGWLPSRAPHRGDVVVFRSPEDPSIDLVKRLIGLPGDRIEMRQKQLLVNGRPVEDATYAVHGDTRLGSERNAYNYQLYRRDNFGPLTVPPGRYFFLGDNRDFSYDSRYWGAVPRHYIKGRAFLIYWSYGGETPDGQPVSLLSKLAQLGRTAAGFLPKTRWNRSLRLIR